MSSQQTLAEKTQLGEKCIEVEEEEEEEEEELDESEEGNDDDDDETSGDAENEDGLTSDGVAGEAADEADGSVAPRRSSRVGAGHAGQQQAVAESNSGSVDAKVHSRRPARRAVQDNFVVERPSKRIALESSMMLNDFLHTTQHVILTLTPSLSPRTPKCYPKHAIAGSCYPGGPGQEYEGGQPGGARGAA
jgi:hypothetical protein